MPSATAGESRPVSGLAIGHEDLKHHLPMPKAQWYVGVSLIAYRCGGSAGLDEFLTGFPFNLMQRDMIRHLNQTR